MNKQIDLIIKDLAKKYNLTEASVNRIIDSQFRFLRDEIESRQLNPIMLTHIGKWYVPTKKKNFLKYKYIPKLEAKEKQDANGIDSTK